MAVNKQAAKRRLDRLLMNLHGHRRDLEAYRNRGDAAGVERCERALEFYRRHIREYCVEHDLELPHDVPDEGAE